MNTVSRIVCVVLKYIYFFKSISLLNCRNSCTSGSYHYSTKYKNIILQCFQYWFWHIHARTQTLSIDVAKHQLRLETLSKFWRTSLRILIRTFQYAMIQKTKRNRFLFFVKFEQNIYIYIWLFERYFWTTRNSSWLKNQRNIIMIDFV